MRSAGARAGGRRPRGSCAGSRRACAPRASARGARASRPSGRAAARAGAPRRRFPGTDCARGTSPSSQSSARRDLPSASQAPEATSASAVSRLSGARWASSTTLANGPPRSRSSTSAAASSSPRESTYSRPIRTTPSCNRALRRAEVDVGRPHLHPTPLRVANEARGRVEAHRLRVQERAQELGRVVVAQPGRLVGEQPERGRVRLREAEAREGDELVVDLVRERVGDALAGRALDEAVAVGLERGLAPLAAHRPPQPLGLPHREPRQRHRHVQHLVLEDDDAERRRGAAPRAAGGRPAGRSAGSSRSFWRRSM